MAGALTGMVLKSGFAVGFLDLIFRGFLFHGKDFIWIDRFGHVIWDIGEIRGFPS